MRRKIGQLRPYSFSSAFVVASEPPDPEDLKISVGDLSALVTQTQITTASLVRDETLSAEAAKLEQASENLTTAPSGIVRLAAQLERAALSPEDRSEALQNVRDIARTLVDGQADLFDQSRSSLGKHSDSG